MNSSPISKLRIGAWKVEPELGQITRDGQTLRIEPRMMRLLLCLAERANQIVSTDQLLDHVWAGVIVSQDSVYQAIASLRRLLGDDSKQARYIVTVPRQGYRMVAAVGEWPEPETNPHALLPEPNVVGAKGSRFARHRIAVVVVSSLAAVIGGALSLQRGSAGLATARMTFAAVSPSQKSIAVLPFLDLTEEMKQEYFADGMTEELIGRFSKIPGFKVPAPTASFYYKGKQIGVAEFARRLDVNYVLDGSVRKSGATVRVAARLMKADNGFVIWTATYDRPLDDLLAVQDDIAEQVTKALIATIDKQGAAFAK